MSIKVKYCARKYIYTHTWHHQIETFSALLAICEGNPPVTGGFPLQRPVTRRFDVFFWSVHEVTAVQTIEPPVIWDAIALIMASL